MQSRSDKPINPYLKSFMSTGFMDMDKGRFQFIGNEKNVKYFPAPDEQLDAKQIEWSMAAIKEEKRVYRNLPIEERAPFFMRHADLHLAKLKAKYIAAMEQDHTRPSTSHSQDRAPFQSPVKVRQVLGNIDKNSDHELEFDALDDESAYSTTMRIEQKLMSIDVETEDIHSMKNAISEMRDLLFDMASHLLLPIANALPKFVRIVENLERAELSEVLEEAKKSAEQGSSQNSDKATLRQAANPADADLYVTENKPKIGHKRNNTSMEEERQAQSKAPKKIHEPYQEPIIRVRIGNPENANPPNAASEQGSPKNPASENSGV